MKRLPVLIASQQRLSDVQDIVISVDERLARLEVALKSPAEPRS